MPILVDLPTPLMDLPFPQRLIDVIGNRMSIDSYTFEYYQQTARVNEAAPVADLALKPTSTFTVEAVSGRAQIIATLSQPCPVRIYWHFQDNRCFHVYDLVSPTASIEELLAEVDHDPTAIFWG